LAKIPAGLNRMASEMMRSMEELDAPEPPHDVLAAEAFAVPSPDPELKHQRVVVPEDPAGIPEPHDVLAADEFPMPAARPHAAGRRSNRDAARKGALVAGAGLLGWLILRRRRFG
jgi:hypothetical protein